jgi:hypothetical protein
MTDVYEFSEFDRHNLIYNYSIMTPQEIEMATEKLKKAEEEAAAKKAAAAAAKAASTPAAQPSALPTTGGTAAQNPKPTGPAPDSSQQPGNS